MAHVGRLSAFEGSTWIAAKAGEAGRHRSATAETTAVLGRVGGSHVLCCMGPTPALYSD